MVRGVKMLAKISEVRTANQRLDALIFNRFVITRSQHYLAFGLLKESFVHSGYEAG